MQLRNFQSVERKLRWIVMLASGTALILAAVGVMVVDVVTFRRGLADNLTMQADIIAESSTVALKFEQAEDAAEVLQALRANGSIRAARLYTRTGEPFATYDAWADDPPAQAPPAGVAFRANRLELVRPVVLNRQTIGFIWICAGLEELERRFLRYAGAAILLLPLAFFAAAWLGNRLQRSVTVPIVELCSAMRLVRDHRDYTTRVRRRENDEVGQLMDGFNAMLQQIEEQDAQLKEERAQLARRVEERTAALQEANTELLISNRRLKDETERAEQLARSADDASRAKSEFLATVSHELRTPMNGVIGFSDLLLDTPLTEEQRQYARTIGNSGQVLLTLINDLLDLSKIEAGKLSVERVPFDVRHCVEEVAGLLVRKADEKGIELVVHLSPTLPGWIIGDPSRFRQVVLNLVGNAIKFTERGHVLVEAGRFEDLATRYPAARGLPMDTPQFLVVVHDTGIGIPREVQAQLFTKFTQADSSMTRKYGGTGLGLAISRRLTEMLGGTIGFVSEPGKGATFWCTFPLHTASPVSSTPEQGLPSGLRILAVTDSEPLLRALGDQLESWGVGHHGVADHEAAMDSAIGAANAGHGFDMILIDQLLPENGALELARRIRSEPRLGGAGLVLITSGRERCELQQFRTGGFDGFLARPLVRPGILREVLGQVLAAGGSAPSEDEDGATETHPRNVPMAAAGGFAARILLAEDNQTNRLYARRLLERMGHHVEVAANGREAVMKALEQAYDVILMDCQMPEMNGYDATLEIRRSEGAGRRVPVVALTANALTGERERCLKVGMDDYIPKPFRREDLARVLEQVIGGRRLGDAGWIGGGTQL
jgi:signal transduction histidine kinase/CheY-like chemotaxis protein